MQAVRHVAFSDDGDTAETRLQKCAFLIEATSNEAYLLWNEYCGESVECRNPVTKRWKQLGGWAVTVGRVDDRPIVVSLDFCRIDGVLVCFWEGCSELVDYKMIRLWLEKWFSGKTPDGRDAVCNATNFHHFTQCLSELKRGEAE